MADGLPEELQRAEKDGVPYYRHRASIITTTLDYDDWFHGLGNKPMVTALLSRLRHQCTTIRIDGPSLRERQG